jgi:drug/metabolite transporter (DMT)-like permease
MVEPAILQNETSHAKGLVIGVLGVLVLSPDALLIRMISIDGWALIFWRGLLMSSTLMLGVAVTNRGRFLATVRRIGCRGVFASMFQAAGSTCFVMSILNTQVANTLIILGALPMFVAVFSAIFLKERASVYTLLAIPVSAIGIAITVHEGVALGNWKGDALALCTACIGSGHLILLRFAKGRNMAPSAALGGFLAASVAFPMAPTLALPLADIPYVLVLGCVVIPIAFTCFVTAPRYIPVPEFSLVVLLEMVFGPYWVWLALGERPADSAVVGGGIVLLTLFIHSTILLRNANEVDNDADTDRNKQQ